MICQLCLKDRLLIKAHIYPDWMHKDFYDDKHRISQYIGYDTSNVHFRPTGEYDNNILCSSCDNEILSTYENHAKKIILDFTDHYKKSQKNLINIGWRQFNVINNIDAKSFHLFLLSLLWRMNITKRPSCQDVNIMPEVSEKLRMMIYDNNKYDIDFLPITLVTYLNDYNLKKQVLCSPIVHEGSQVINLVFNGLICSFLLGFEYKQDFDSYSILKNEIRIMEFEPLILRHFLYELVGIDLWA